MKNTDSPHEVLFEGGGTMNGVHFSNFAELFESLGVKVASGYLSPFTEKPYDNTLTKKQKAERKKRKKRERQRRRKG